MLDKSMNKDNIIETVDDNKKSLESKKRKAINRLYIILELQKNLYNEFGCENYNVFIFGSYLTVDYIEGKSDIDIAIYCEDFHIYNNIALFIENYFMLCNINSDIFYIDISMSAPIFLAPLNSKVCLTDYYPDVLLLFKNECERNLELIKMELMV